MINEVFFEELLSRQQESGLNVQESCQRSGMSQAEFAALNQLSISKLQLDQKGKRKQPETRPRDRKFQILSG